ncbi:MAG: DinB family protein [Pseudomonadota bacterium]
MKQLFVMLANYNRWANGRLYDAAFALSEDDYRRDEGAFFKSIHGTLNHLVVGDRIWLARFRGTTARVTQLDAIIADDRPSLRAQRDATDQELIAYVESLTEGDLASTFSYTTITRPQKVTQPLAPALVHTFNHQTHHRGQIHALLTRLAGEAPSLDLIFYQRETGDGLSLEDPSAGAAGA